MSIAIAHLTRRFETAAAAALDDLSLDIAKGEFVALLGPSGSGKTTLLRILAGLDFPDTGSVTRDGTDLLGLDARRRGVGMVFLHYALFRHMRVADNVAFGLRVRKRSDRPAREEIVSRVDRLLERVELAGYGDRYPAQLSGGQRQRVALARALATEPSLLLLDEPFGALDAKVRASLRRWLRHLHEDLRLTTVFVTHDQEEALELADRVVVMNRGRIEQVGPPESIYREPATPFVFEFIGAANRLDARIAGGTLEIAGRAIASGLALPDGGALAYLRPEHLWIDTRSGDDAHSWAATVLHLTPAGSAMRAELEVEGFTQPLEAEFAGYFAQRLALRPGAALRVHPTRITVFPESAQGGAVDAQPVIVEMPLGGEG